MKFEKKLIILCGAGAKGTLSMERNAYGVFATLNVYNLPDLKSGEYRLGLKTAEGCVTRGLGAAGRILVQFRLEIAELSAVHCVVFDAAKETPLLYGTNAPAKLWPGNVMDGLRSKEGESKKEIKAESEETFPPYSGRGANIKDYFFDITPGERIELPAPEESELLNEAANLLAGAKRVTEYNDQALAEVNYFAKEFLPAGGFTYSGQDEVDPDELLNPVDRYLRTDGDGETEILPWDSSASAMPEEQSANPAAHMPWQYARAYLNRREDPVAAQSVQPPVRPEDSTNAPAPPFDKNVGDAAVFAAPVKSLRPAARDSVASEKPPLAVKTNVASAPKKKPESEAAFTVPPASNYRAENAAASFVPESVFYEQIKSQIDGLFTSCERYAVLEELMPETKWVRVNYDDVKFYVVGLVGKRPDYICYGVPAEYAPVPPAELGEDCRWLPENPEKPEGKGFWLMFQDAVTGEAEG